MSDSVRRKLLKRADESVMSPVKSSALTDRWRILPTWLTALIVPAKRFAGTRMSMSALAFAAVVRSLSTCNEKNISTVSVGNTRKQRNRLIDAVIKRLTLAVLAISGAASELLDAARYGLGERRIDLELGGNTSLLPGLISNAHMLDWGNRRLYNGVTSVARPL
ncbi:MAG: hypothetical protein M3Z14_00645 [Candidatus Eremiobacteraeota bacterium]|nr:hypothetical protein [Candidatus Eremiobacteraeota bacterium]